MKTTRRPHQLESMSEFIHKFCLFTNYERPYWWDIFGPMMLRENFYLSSICAQVSHWLVIYICSWVTWLARTRSTTSHKLIMIITSVSPEWKQMTPMGISSALQSASKFKSVADLVMMSQCLIFRLCKIYNGFLWRFHLGKLTKFYVLNFYRHWVNLSPAEKLRHPLGQLLLVFCCAKLMPSTISWSSKPCFTERSRSFNSWRFRHLMTFKTGLRDNRSNFT